MKSKIKVPIHLCEEEMENAGKAMSECSWTDDQLGKQIRALKNVIAFLKARGDCKIVVDTLRRELYSFQDFKYSREDSRQF